MVLLVGLCLCRYTSDVDGVSALFALGEPVSLSEVMHSILSTLLAFENDSAWLFVVEEHWLLAALNGQQESTADDPGDDEKFGEVFHGLRLLPI